MVKLRLKRMGKKRNPIYRIVVADARSPRDGRNIDEIGLYDPNQEPCVVKIDEEAAKEAFCPDMPECKREVEDFTDSSVIVECMDKKYKTAYTIDGDKAVLSGDVYEVKEKYTFTQKVGKIISKIP